MTHSRPDDERVPVERAISPGHGRLPGTSRLLDISKPRGNVLLDRLRRRLAERLPDVSSTATPSRPSRSPRRIDAARRSASNDFVIEALAD